MTAAPAFPLGNRNEIGTDQGSTVRRPPDTVVSRFADGRIASRLGDLYWNWTPFVNGGREARLSFKFWGPSHRYQSINPYIPPEHGPMVADMQHLMDLVVFRRSGETYEYGMLFAFLAHLKRIARYCGAKNISLSDFFGDPKLITQYSRSIKSKTLARFSGLLSILTKLDPEKEVGFHVAGNPILTELRKRVTQMIKGALQTPPLPTRIYSIILSNLEQELLDFQKIAAPYFKMIKMAQHLKKTLLPRSNEARSIVRDLVTANPSLNDYFESKRLPKDPKGVSRGLSEIQLLCKLQIQAFSGMRHSEACMLPYHCMEKETRNGRIHFILSGFTTKLNKGKMHRAKWVTSPDGYRAVSLAQRIAKFVYRELGIKPSRPRGLVSQHPLFVSISYLGFGTTRPHASSMSFKAPALLIQNNGDGRLRQLLCPTITENDLQELEAIDEARAWRAEDCFRLGVPWPLESHQFRRSLALYAQRSGLVSLPSLKRQLQHITQEMTRYYTKGSSFAINFIDHDPEVFKTHMAREWRDGVALSEGLAFLRDVIFSNEELFGGAGSFEQGKRNRGEVVDRKVTLSRFRRGEISYAQTPFGGCVKIGECNQVGMRMVETDCLKNCLSAVGKLSKLNNVIRMQEKLVRGLDRDSVEFRMESSDLRALKMARKKWQDLSTRRRNAQRT
ncbi:hypothetical protein [Paraburkholderia sp. RL17-381-BIF-C]|uniref:hypothetical protein n=1 Tax=Paraburkholderia sp. RL17-381-BIF-C TaxID=3031635 RepID=UPI0038B6D8D4